MIYSKNILPTDEVYYELQGASIRNGSLILDAYGSASIEVTTDLLTSIPSSFMFNFVVDTEIDTQDPELSVSVEIELKNGTHQQYSIFPAGRAANQPIAIPVDTDEGDYYKCVVTFASRKRLTMSLWEMHPESGDTEIKTIIDGVEQSLPHVLYDYNTWTLSVEQIETAIGLIACNLHGATDVNGHLSVDFYSTEYCTMYIRFKDNGVTELYAPLKFTVNPGLNTIGIPHAYLKRTVGVHNFVVTCQCTNGALTIYPRGLLYTIDAGYLAERINDIGMDVLDITIEQQQVSYEPDKIWAIGLDAGEFLVKTCKYGTSAAAAWTPKYTLGRGQLAAIEFDGNWVYNDNTNRYCIVTEEEPYIFIVRENNDLVVYYGNDESTEFLLASNVNHVSACKGYSSIVYPEQDQGLVICYVRDNQAYIRSFAYSPVLGRKTWAPEQLVCDGAIEAYVSRLNDYRISIQVRTEEANLWYISERTYVSQAAPSDTGQISAMTSDFFVSVVKPEWSLNGAVNAFANPSAPQSTFYIEWPYDVRLGKLYYQLIDCLTVYVNGTALDVYENAYKVNLYQNRLTITFAKPIHNQGFSDTTVKVVLSDYAFVLLVGGRNAIINDTEFTWIIEADKPKMSDIAYISFTPSFNIRQLPLQHKNTHQSDTAVYDIQTTVSITPRAVSTAFGKHTDVAQIGFNYSVSVTPIMITSSPI